MKKQSQIGCAGLAFDVNIDIGRPRMGLPPFRYASRIDKARKKGTIASKQSLL